MEIIVFDASLFYRKKCEKWRRPGRLRRQERDKMDQSASSLLSLFMDNWISAFPAIQRFWQFSMLRPNKFWHVSVKCKMFNHHLCRSLLYRDKSKQTISESFFKFEMKFKLQRRLWINFYRVVGFSLINSRKVSLILTFFVFVCSHFSTQSQQQHLFNRKTRSHWEADDDVHRYFLFPSRSLTLSMSQSVDRDLNLFMETTTLSRAQSGFNDSGGEAS